MAPQPPRQRLKQVARMSAPNGVIQGGVQKLQNGLLKLEANDAVLHIAQRNQHESPLLLLPAELRNKIYGYVLGGKYLEAQSIWSRDKLSFLLPQDPHWLALLFVCRQIYTETAVLTFKLNKFGFETNSDLAGWIKKLLPGQREAIESLRYLRTFFDIYIDAAGQSEVLFKDVPRFKSAYKELFSVKRLSKIEEFPSLKRIYVWRDYSPHDCGVVVIPNYVTERFIRVSAGEDVEIIFEGDDQKG